MIKNWLLIGLFMTCSILNGQVERPNAQEYTINSVYQKLIKSYPSIKPITIPISTKINITEDIEIQKIHEFQQKVDLYQPKNISSKRPVVILIHGGGWISGSKKNQKNFALILAENNYNALAIDYRLSDISKFPAALQDIETAIDWVIKNKFLYQFDTDNIILLGDSAGGQLASLASVKNYNSIKATVNIDGIVSFIDPESQEGNYAAYFLGGTKETHFNIWKQASPLEFVNRKTPSILFINSSQPRFHAGRDTMIDQLNSYNIYNEVHEIKNSPHSFWHVDPWFTQTMKITLGFLKKATQ